ncbi:hypothetical protein AB0H77_22145 [Streptomyces sp. NPDC050844]|uniref:cyanobactin maturation protease PatG family protein n=1 Tax=Streptomyces sp. NPDC050844 TaxID=3155790 RepID=UPI0033D5885F
METPEDAPGTAELPPSAVPHPPAPTASLPAGPGEAAPLGSCCSDCAGGRESRPAQPEAEPVYAIGRVEVRFPTLGLEREFQQRLAQLPEADADESRGSQMRRVLEANPHVAARMTYTFVVAGVPAFVLAPTGRYLQEQLLTAVEHSADQEYWCVLIGRRGPMARPEMAGGVLAPVVACDHLYCFAFEEWQASLEQQLAPVTKAERISGTTLVTVTKELFSQVISSTENIGVTDAHRALNYVVVQHPGLFLAAAERRGKQVMERIEARQIHGLGTRRVVAVILTFLNVTTGVPERLFTRVDVTEEWPFIADREDGTRAPLGLLPYVENELMGLAY